MLWSDAPELLGRTVTESWIARTPLRNHKPLALPAMLPTWRMPLGSDPDWVLVSSHLFAHHVRTPARTKKFVYAHTPARYIWEPERDERGNSRARARGQRRAQADRPPPRGRGDLDRGQQQLHRRARAARRGTSRRR